MGAVMGLCSIASWVPCLCSSAPCLVCACCPSSKNSTVTRLVYAVFLLMGTITACLMLTPSIESKLKEIPGFCERGAGSHIPGMHGVVNCDSLVGFKAVYRVCFALAMFFLLFALIMLGLKSSKDPRAPVHNGFWFFKFAALVGITVGAFYIPEGAFTTVWFYIGMAGAFCFILIQLVLLIDFAHSWNETWVEKMEEGNSRCWYAALLSVTGIGYGLSITAVILFYVYYTVKDNCAENKFFISFNLILCFLASITSILPKIQEAQPRSGLLQSSVITLYTMYITWSAMSSEPDKQCNPGLLNIIIHSKTIDNGTVTPTVTPHAGQWWDAQSIVGLAIYLLCILYSRLETVVLVMEDPFLEDTMEMNPQENESLLIAGPEDEDFLEDEARIMKNDHGPFSDITLLKQRPAHMAVFLQFVMKQHDPVPLLFFLCDDILKNDQHKSQEIRSLFFNQNAPVRSSFPEEIEMHLRPLSENHSDEDFLSAEEKTLKWATDIVIRQLEDYRKQRVMGLASIYGDHTLTEILQGSTREMTVASQLFKNIHNEISNKEEEKSNAVLKAVEGYLKYCGISIEVIGRRRHLLNLKKNLIARREKEKEKEERKEREKGRGQASLLKDVLCPAHRSHLDEGGISNVNHMVKKFEQPMQDTRESRGASNRKLGHNTRLGRSESWKGYSDVHHKVCHPGSPRSMSDVDLSAGRGTIPKQRPSLKLARAEAAVPTFSDSLFENNANLMVEAEAFDWQASMSRDVLKQLSNQTIKRQDVINELFHTERLHVKSLFVLKVLFRDNLVEKGVMEEALAENVFPHLASLLQQHGRINAVMRNMQQPGVIVGFIGDMLVEQFSGENAQQLQQAAAAFCSQQSAALETLKHNQKKDQKFQQVIQAAESSPHCRRLQLKDLLPAEMQRLTKYPLLLKKLAKYSSENAEEQHKVQAATEHCCQILDHVNQSVREAENAFHLQGYQRKLDLSALQTEKNSPLCQYKNLNLTEHRMLHEGPLTWRLTKEKSIDLQVLLLQDLLVLLQKQEDRLVLRAHSLPTRVPGMSKQVYNPILPLGGLLLRDDARDGKAFFILYLSTNGALMYEFCAGSVSGRKAWWNAINLAQAACNSVSMVTVPTSQRYREGNRAQSPPPRKPVDPDQGTKGITNEEGRCKSDSISASWQQEEIVKAALRSAGHIQVTLKDYFQRSRGKKEEMGTISSPSTPISPTPSTPISPTPSTPISPSPSTQIGPSLPTSIHLSVPQFGGIASNERETQDISTCSQVPVDFLIKNLQVTENEDGEEPKADERHIDSLAMEEDILGELAKLTQLLLTLKTETLPCDV